MQRIGISFIVVLFFSLSASAQMSKQEIIGLLIKNQGIQLDAKTHIGCKNEKLGDYISMLIANGSEGDLHSITAKCLPLSKTKTKFPIPQKKDEPLVCELKAHSSDKAGESPWTYWFKFWLNSKTKKIVRKSMSCPGVP